jgi:hypothetical protein
VRDIARYQKMLPKAQARFDELNAENVLAAEVKR